MSFFRNFPLTKYDFLLNGVTTNIVDLFRYVHTTDQILDDAKSYKFYEIHDGERPDQIAYKLYGDPDYYWTFFIINDHLHQGMSGWPLSTQEFEKYIASEYEGVVLTGRPRLALTSDAEVIIGNDELTGTVNSVAGRFILGETIVGANGASGKLVGKNTRYNSIILEEVEGTFVENEIITGQTSGDGIYLYRSYERQHAPKFYLNEEGVETDIEAYIPLNNTGLNDVVLNDNERGLNEVELVSNREWEERKNDERSRIRIIRPEFIEDFVENYKKLVRL